MTRAEILLMLQRLQEISVVSGMTFNLADFVVQGGFAFIFGLGILIGLKVME